MLFPSDSPYSLAGNMLVATPALSQTIFAQSVIYLCAHSHQSGAVGIVVNARLENRVLDEIFSHLDLALRSPQIKKHVTTSAGGPVESNRGLILYSGEWSSENTMPVTKDINLSTSISVLNNILSRNTSHKILLALGYASWEANQLEEELKQNAWLVLPADEQLIFHKNHIGKWKRALNLLGIEPAQLTAFYGHA